VVLSIAGDRDDNYRTSPVILILIFFNFFYMFPDFDMLILKIIFKK
jgi:hypothetical protein